MYSTLAGNETKKDTKFKYFLLKSTKNCEDIGVLDFEKRFIWSGENISWKWQRFSLNSSEIARKELLFSKICQKSKNEFRDP